MVAPAVAAPRPVAPAVVADVFATAATGKTLRLAMGGPQPNQQVFAARLTLAVGGTAPAAHRHDVAADGHDPVIVVGCAGPDGSIRSPGPVLTAIGHHQTEDRPDRRRPRCDFPT
jgi:hypothetical protein